MKRTLVIGASENPARVSNTAICKLRAANHEVEAIGLRVGNVNGVSFHLGLPELTSIDTVTLYIGKKNQSNYYDYVFSLNPNRVIFNPGTENDEFLKQLRAKDIDAFEACTLVMLATGSY